MVMVLVVLGGMASIWFLGALSETGRVCCWWFPWWRGFCGRIFHVGSAVSTCRYALMELIEQFD